MAVFRVERTRDYTVMSNYHLRDKRLSLKAKGLLSQMLSLPENWDYTLSGLSQINRESKDAIRTAVNELEKAGYVIRRQTTDKNGKFGVNEYIIYERPRNSEPPLEEPLSEKPTTDKPTTEEPSPDNPMQLNTKQSSKEKYKTDISNTDSFPSGFPEQPMCSMGTERREAMSIECICNYRALIMENIGYEILLGRYPARQDDLDEILELMVETVCANRKTTRIAGSDFPHEVIRSRFLKLNSEHISFVLDCLGKNTTEVRNMKQYLLTVLFNAPTTMSNHYTAQVNHDLSTWQGSNF